MNRYTVRPRVDLALTLLSPSFKPDLRHGSYLHTSLRLEYRPCLLRIIHLIKFWFSPGFKFASRPGFVLGGRENLELRPGLDLFCPVRFNPDLDLIRDKG